MQTYLRPGLLEAARWSNWETARRFHATHTTVKVNATGAKPRPMTTVGKLTNSPGLLALSSVYSDVVTGDQMPLRLPPWSVSSVRSWARDTYFANAAGGTDQYEGKLLKLSAADRSAGGKQGSADDRTSPLT
jgi:hypothetical protein